MFFSEYYKIFKNTYLEAAFELEDIILNTEITSPCLKTFTAREKKSPNDVKFWK